MGSSLGAGHLKGARGYSCEDGCTQKETASSSLEPFHLSRRKAGADIRCTAEALDVVTVDFATASLLGETAKQKET